MPSPLNGDVIRPLFGLETEAVLEAGAPATGNADPEHRPRIGLAGNQHRDPPGGAGGERDLPLPGGERFHCVE